MNNLNFYKRLDYSKSATQKFENFIIDRCAGKNVIVICKRSDKTKVYQLIANILHYTRASYKFFCLENNDDVYCNSIIKHIEQKQCDYIIGIGDDGCSSLVKNMATKTDCKTVFYALTPNMLLTLGNNSIKNSPVFGIYETKYIDYIFIDENTIENCELCELEKAKQMIECFNLYMLDAELNAHIIDSYKLANWMNNAKEIIDYSLGAKNTDKLSVMDAIVELADIIDYSKCDCNSIFEAAIFFSDKYKNSFESAVDVTNKIKMNLYKNYIKIKKISIFDINNRNIDINMQKKDMLLKKINAIKPLIKKTINKYSQSQNESFIKIPSEKALKILLEFVPVKQKSKMFEAIRYSGFI